MWPDLATCPLGRWEDHLHLRAAVLNIYTRNKTKVLISNLNQLMGGQESSLTKAGVGSRQRGCRAVQQPVRSRVGPLCKLSSLQDKFPLHKVAPVLTQTQNYLPVSILMTAFWWQRFSLFHVYAFYFFFLSNCIGCISQIISNNNANNCHSLLLLALIGIISMFYNCYDSEKWAKNIFISFKSIFLI